MKYNIYSIPNEVRGLEYLNLLYKNTMGEDEAGNVFELKKFSWKILFSRFSKGEKNIIHIHWETNIYGSAYILLSIIRMAWRFPTLIIFRLRDFKIVWTMHNLRAHDYPHPKIDTLGRFFMWRVVNTVVMMQEDYAKEARRRFPNLEITFIPQGNYVNAYGPLWIGDKNKLKEKYGLRSDEVILLSLGSIRPYKELPRLARIIKNAHLKGAPIHLFVVGKLAGEYKEIFLSEIGDNSCVTLYPNFIPDEDIPEVHALADYSVFYYDDSSNTSGSLMLSLSYSVPVITSVNLQAGVIVPNKNGLIFKDEKELEEILLKIKTINLANKQDIIKTIDDCSWPVIGAKLRKAYQNMWV